MYSTRARHTEQFTEHYTNILRWPAMYSRKSGDKPDRARGLGNVNDAKSLIECETVSLEKQPGEVQGEFREFREFEGEFREFKEFEGEFQELEGEFREFQGEFRELEQSQKSQKPQNHLTSYDSNLLNHQEEEVAVKKKSSTQKDENHLLRQRQIEEYTCVVSREARDKRYKLRQGMLPEESPKKRKRVGFILDEDTFQDVDKHGP